VTDFNAILPAFEALMEADYRKTKEQQLSDRKLRFKRVQPPPKTVEEKVQEVFKPGDDQLIRSVGWAAQLQQETGKDMKACIKCLNDVKNYDQAKMLLLQPVIPTKYWADDKDVSACTSCKKAFRSSLLSSNKHHCRICGGIFCSACSPQRRVNDAISKSKVRVCEACFSKEGMAQTLNNIEFLKEIERRREMPLPRKKSPSKKSGLQAKTGTGSKLISPKSAVTSENKPPLSSKKNDWKLAPNQAAKVPMNQGGGIKKPGARELYTDDHINWLLTLHLGDRQDTDVINGISAHLHGGRTLRQNLFDGLQSVAKKGQTKMVVPVNVHGSHWVGVYVHFLTESREDGLMYHVDPLGGRPTKDLAEALEFNFPRLKLNVSRVRYQQDNFNCGPWVVALLEYMVRHDGDLPRKNAINITARRAQDRQQF